MFYPRPTRKPSAKYCILVLFLLVLFATGGASRTDIESLVILRPLSVILCALGWITLRREHLEGRGLLFGWVGAIFVLTLLHLIPLPPAIWQSLGAREDLVDVEKMSGLADIWRPLTLAPIDGWHAFVSLFVPLGVILLGVQLTRNELFGLLPVVMCLATLSGLLGLLQVIGDPKGSLYFYALTNNGSAVGLFANRNHAATLLALLFPLLAIFASSGSDQADSMRMRRMIAPAIAIVLVPLILVTGSRSGLVSAVIGLVAAAVLYRQPSNACNSRPEKLGRFKAFAILAGVGVTSIAFLTYFFARAEAIERLLIKSSGVDDRTDFWTVSIDLLVKHLSWGSGSGSFVYAYRVAEPTRLLDTTYLNHAHNDWVETAVTFGLPGVIGVLVVFITYGIRSYRLWRNTDGSKRAIAFGRLASVMIAIIAIASFSDYPLRAPTMMGLFAICALWLTETTRDRSSLAAARARNN